MKNNKQQRIRRRKPRYHAMDVILAIMAVLLIAFTVAMIILFVKYQAVPDTLITAFFSAFGAEGGFMAVIMVAKKLTENKNDEESS